MAQFLGGTLVEEMRGYRGILDTHVRVPLLQWIAGEDADAPNDKLAAVCFKIRLLDALVDLFRLYDPEAVAADAREATARLHRGVTPTSRQVDAMLRARAKTLELDRQIAFAHVAHLLMATDGLRHRDRELYPVEFEELDAHFGRHYGQWAIGVAPMIAAFCRNPGRDQDTRLRAALDDFVFQLRKTAPEQRRMLPPIDMAHIAVAGHAD